MATNFVPQCGIELFEAEYKCPGKIVQQVNAFFLIFFGGLKRVKQSNR
jgi:hypothetical protein